MATPLPQTRPWREWYQLERWRRLRRAQLRVHPLCAMCASRGVVTVATIADHVVSHGGDWNEFLTGALQSLCEPCHNRDKRLLGTRGYRSDVGDDGWPLGPAHPANKR
jgi:5-methylcytosine-specific restriction protein A